MFSLQIKNHVLVFKIYIYNKNKKNLDSLVQDFFYPFPISGITEVTCEGLILS